MTREELEVLCDGYALIYNKTDADSVMDAMEQRIKVLNAEYDLLKSASNQKIESLEKQLEDVQNTMATDNVDLGMENYKLKERALWLARAERASSEKAHYYIMSTYCEPHSNKQKWMKRISFTWEKVERKCREKAEEYR